ncbi:hypothetical protein MKQ70_33515 [Chitinophaga sedimenti]|uniref:hypothetical protein n=1 Tax=Chitinophaga sedimenti TaxID=2033606 RepID=UPI002003EF57|nr:hypothetical protein [Chitinophaga sedimenti]MCK7559606.1 hypothetical protein [Chitinophaga sedimenti]
MATVKILQNMVWDGLPHFSPLLPHFYTVTIITPDFSKFHAYFPLTLFATTSSKTPFPDQNPHFQQIPYCAMMARSSEGLDFIHTKSTEYRALSTFYPQKPTNTRSFNPSNADSHTQFPLWKKFATHFFVRKWEKVLFCVRKWNLIGKTLNLTGFLGEYEATLDAKVASCSPPALKSSWQRARATSLCLTGVSKSV